jgi:hypothetical protein
MKLFVVVLLFAFVAAEAKKPIRRLNVSMFFFWPTKPGPFQTLAMKLISFSMIFVFVEISSLDQQQSSWYTGSQVDEFYFFSYSCGCP